MLTQKLLALAAIVISGTSFSSAQAAVILWSNPGTPTPLNNNGDATTTLGQLITGTEVFGACAVACNPTTQTINDTLNGRTLTFDRMLFTQGGHGFGFALPNTGITVLNNMTKEGGQGASGRGTVATAITGLTVGNSYKLQVFFWLQTGNNGGQRINGTMFAVAGSTNPLFAIGTFNADAATQALTVTGGRNNNLSMVLVTDADSAPVPEPASVSLVAAGLVGFAAVSRRRSMRRGLIRP